MTPVSTPRDRFIVALDFPSAASALAFVDRLDGHCLWFKVGLELFCAAGPSIVETLRSRGHEVFLDLKLHDIPNTVAGAIRSVASLGASLVNVHASGGLPMMHAAAEAAAAVPGSPRLLAVTILTSMDAAQLAATGVPDSPADQVIRLARLANASGLHGLVCSAEETARLRAEFPDLLLVTPGIRPTGAALNDQSRIATPAAALRAGASMLVVGRPITQAPHPAAAAAALLAEMETALP